MTINAITEVALLSLIFLGFGYFIGVWARAIWPTLIGYVVHWVVAFGTFAAAGLLVPDAVLYDEMALGEHPESPLPLGKEGWTLLLTGLYRIFGHNPGVGLAVNVLAATVTTGVIARTATHLGLPGTRSAWIAALWPSGILWSSLLLRESITWMFLALCMLGFAGLATSPKWRTYGLVLLVSAVGLFEFRGTAALIAVAAGGIALLIARRNYLLLAAATIAAALVVTGPLGAPIRDVFGQYSLERILYSRQWLSENATTGFPIDNLWEVLVRVLIGPLPWEWGVVGPIFALDGVVWVLMVILAVRGWQESGDRRLILILVLPAVALWVSLAVNSGNYGTMQRLRALPELLLLPLAAAGSVWRRRTSIESPWDLPAADAPARRIISRAVTPVGSAHVDQATARTQRR